MLQGLAAVGWVPWMSSLVCVNSSLEMAAGSILTPLAGGRLAQLEQMFPLAALTPPCRRLFPVQGGEGQTCYTMEEFFAVA